MIWTRIYSSPLVQMYGDPRARDFTDDEFPQHDILLDPGTLVSSSSINEESAAFTVTIQNKNGEASRILAFPPIGARLENLYDSDVVARGTISRVTLDTTATFQVQG